MNRAIENILIAIGFAVLMAAVVGGFVCFFWIVERITGYTEGLFRMAGM